jgi:ElaB/YqjD/DUF883 family membrane-anchored ribosome-binding protein
MLGQVADARQRLERSLENVVVDAEGLLKAVGREGGAQVGAAREKLERQLTSAREELDRARSAVDERARAAARAVDETVHEHPWTTAGLATAVGAVIGLLVGMLIVRR